MWPAVRRHRSLSIPVSHSRKLPRRKRERERGRHAKRASNIDKFSRLKSIFLQPCSVLHPCGCFFPDLQQRLWWGKPTVSALNVIHAKCVIRAQVCWPGLFKVQSFFFTMIDFGGGPFGHLSFLNNVIFTTTKTILTITSSVNTHHIFFCNYI